MKRFTLITLAIALLAGMAGTVHADEQGARWLAKIDSAETVPFSSGTMTQTVTTTTGSERTLTFLSFSADSGDVSLMAYTEPARVAGDKILLRDGGDEVWYYMNRRDVTRHYAGHTLKQSAMGSDFSYQDLSQGELQDDYTDEYLGEETLDGEPVVKLKLTPTPDGPTYDHVILWASTNDYLSRKIEYYDEDGHEKTLTLSDFKVVDGRKTAHTMRMENLRRGSHTVMNIEELDYKTKPDDWLFTQAALSREVSR